MADIRLAKPAAGASETVACEPSARFVFDFPTSDATLARDGDNLNISFEDGSKLQLQDFYKEYNEENLPSFSVDGTDVTAQDFFQAMNEPDLMPAAGPGNSPTPTGARFHEWGGSELTGGIEHLNGLDWGFSRAFEWEDHPNAVGYHHDDEGGWQGVPVNHPVTLTPGNPGVVPPDTPDLPVEGVTPGSMDPTAPSDVRFISEAGVRGGKQAHVRGAMQVEAPDGVASIEIAGQTIWQNGHMVGKPSFGTDEGYFHNFAYDAASGRLTYTFTLTGATQEHTQQGPDSIAHSLPIVVRDVDGDSASGRLTIVIEDDVPVFAEPEYTGGVEYNAPKELSYLFDKPEGFDGYKGFNVKGENADGKLSLWQSSDNSGSVVYDKNDAMGNERPPSQLVGDEENVNFNMTASFVHYEYAIDPNTGHLTVTNVVDISKTIANSGKAFEISPEKGLGMGNGIGDNAWNAAHPGEFSTGARLTTDSTRAANWYDKYNNPTAQYNMMKDAYGDKFQGGDISLANVSEAVVFDLNDLAYGIELDLGSFGEDDRVLVTFLTTAPYSDDNHIGEWVEIAFNNLDSRVTLLDNGHYRIEVPDGFTKAIVSAVGSAAYVGDGLHAQLKPGHTETSGFSIKNVEFLTPHWTQAGSVQAASADEGIVYGWDFSEFPETVEVQGYYAGTYRLEIQELGPGKWQAVMRDGPEGNQYENHPLFEFSLDKDTGKWTYEQHHEFTGPDGKDSHSFTITATDADGDVASMDLSLGGQFVRFDEVGQGHYDPAYGTDPTLDTADDVLLGSDGASLLYGKGGDDLVLGDRFAEGVDEATGAVKDIIDTIGAQKNDSYDDEPHPTLTDGLHDKLDGLSPEQLGELASALERHEATGGDDLIYGGVGNDILLGMKGNDTLYGEKGSDYLFGGSGDDYLDGGAGRDTLVGGSGDDVLVGGNGGTGLVQSVNANFAFLVDVSDKEGLADVTAQLKALFAEMQEKYADNKGDVNILLMGFHSFAVETVSVDIRKPNAWAELEKGLKNIKDYTLTVKGSQYSHDESEDITQLSPSGSNHELAFNYANGWLYGQQSGHEGQTAENQIFMFSSSEAKSHLYTGSSVEGPNGIFTASKNDGGVTPHTSAGLAGYAKNKDILSIDKDSGCLVVKNYTLGETADIYDASGNIIIHINASGGLEYEHTWKTYADYEVGTPRRGYRDPMVETEPLAGDDSGTKTKPLVLRFDGKQWVLAAVTGGVTNGVYDTDTSNSSHSEAEYGLLSNGASVTIVTSSEVNSIGNYGNDEDQRDYDTADLVAAMPAPTYEGDTLLGGDDNDVLFGDSMPHDFAGKSAGEILQAVKQDPHSFENKGDVAGDRAENDKLYGGDGDDVLFGGAGDDELHGGAKDDYLYGGSGDDKLYGDGGKDYLYGGSGNDYLDGGSGNDYLDGGSGKDYLYGGAGDDLIVFDAADYLIDGGEGIDFLLSAEAKPLGLDGKPVTLDAMHQNWQAVQGGGEANANMPQVSDTVEVMLKGVDPGLQNMGDLAAKYGFELVHTKDGKDILKLREDMWKGPENGEATGGTTTYQFTGGDENVTLETSLSLNDADNAHIEMIKAISG